jgi:VWFA-related protein
MSIRYGSWVFLFCLFPPAGFGQQNGPAAQSRRITLDVAVTEKSGSPVLGLQPNDFTLLDNKQPQKILSFHAVESGTAADPPVEAVLLVDEINTPFTGVAMERDAIEKFLGQNGGRLALPVSVVLLSDSGTVVRTAPSRDGNALIADLNKADFGLRTIRKSVQGFFGADDQRRLSIDALGQLAKSEAAKPGRKLVVWISPGWPLFPGLGAELSSGDQQAVFTDIVAFSDNLRRAGITLYNVDPWGPTQDQLERTAYEQFLKGVKNRGQAELGSLGLQVLAYQSGGRVLNASNDVAGEIATCVMDGTAFYVLTFDGLPGDGPNEYHELEVKIDKPKLTVRAPSGYYSQPEQVGGR